jgi:hypothetical protein
VFKGLNNRPVPVFVLLALLSLTAFSRLDERASFDYSNPSVGDYENFNNEIIRGGVAFLILI